MQPEKWQDPYQKVLNLKYMLLSLLATALIGLGMVAHFFPEFLSGLDTSLRSRLQENWIVLLALGVIIGLFNALSLIMANKKSTPDT